MYFEANTELEKKTDMFDLASRQPCWLFWTGSNAVQVNDTTLLIYEALILEQKIANDIQTLRGHQMGPSFLSLGYRPSGIIRRSALDLPSAGLSISQDQEVFLAALANPKRRGQPYAKASSMDVFPTGTEVQSKASALTVTLTPRQSEVRAQTPSWRS